MVISAEKQKAKEQFEYRLREYINEFNEAISTSNGDWIVKGFIDIAKRIYAVSVDTKVVSKIMEILLTPKIRGLAKDFGYKVIICKEQNFYPDISLIDQSNNKFALDLKTTYRKNSTTVNGMTLGAFTGYFRDRKSSKNCTFPYDEYLAHYVLGII